MAGLTRRPWPRANCSNIKCCNRPFFLAAGNLLYLLIWIGLACSGPLVLAQDRTARPRPGQPMRRLSALGLILYVLTATFAAYDWLLSLGRSGIHLFTAFCSLWGRFWRPLPLP